jgi:PadR family transcriptional regulator PadR
MRPDTLRGHLDALILSVLERQPLHGYAVIEALQEHSGGALDLPTGTVYPALRRLERAGRKRRTYELTGAGRKTLGAERTEWLSFAAVIEGVLRPGMAT